MTIENKQARTVKPTHPGAMLREDFLPDYGLSATSLADALSVSRQTINEILRAGRFHPAWHCCCEFANSDGKDEFVHPIIKGILLHFWLAYVHPFMDGNGRTAKAQYYRSFLYSEMDGNDATYFLVYNLKAIHKAIEILNEYIRRKQKEKKHAYRLAAQYNSLNPRQRMLLASAFEKPQELYTIEKHSNVHGVTYQTARTDLLGLKDLGLLEMHKEGKKFVFKPARFVRKDERVMPADYNPDRFVKNREVTPGRVTLVLLI